MKLIMQPDDPDPWLDRAGQAELLRTTPGMINRWRQGHPPGSPTPYPTFRPDARKIGRTMCARRSWLLAWDEIRNKQVGRPKARPDEVTIDQHRALAELDKGSRGRMPTMRMLKKLDRLGYIELSDVVDWTSARVKNEKLIDQLRRLKAEGKLSYGWTLTERGRQIVSGEWRRDR